MANAYQTNAYYNNGYAQAQPQAQIMPQMQQNYQQVIPMPVAQQQQQASPAKPQESPYKYPTQIVCAKRSEINLYANLFLRTPTEEELKDGIAPGMDAYGRTRFDVYLFKAEMKKSIKYCIGPKTVKLLFEKTKALIANTATPKQKKNAEVKLSSGYTVRLKGGAGFSGKTPAEILIENPDSYNSLLKQRDYLLQNANHPKYGKHNREMVDAINDAAIKFNEKTLDGNLVTVSTGILLNEIKTPNVRKVDNRGLTEARQFKITYSEGAEAPYILEIMNCMAPPTSAAVGADLSKSQDMTKWNISLTEAEWFDFISELMYTCLDIRDMTRKRRFAVYETAPKFF